MNKIKTGSMQKILLIEDNEALRENTAEILSLASFQVSTAENGKQGIEMALTNPPDLIVCDIMMPILDGYGVYQIISKNEALQNQLQILLLPKDPNDNRNIYLEVRAGTGGDEAILDRAAQRVAADAVLPAGLGLFVAKVGALPAGD